MNKKLKKRNKSKLLVILYKIIEKLSQINRFLNNKLISKNREKLMKSLNF